MNKRISLIEKLYFSESKDDKEESKVNLYYINIIRNTI